MLAEMLHLGNLTSRILPVYGSSAIRFGWFRQSYYCRDEAQVLGLNQHGDETSRLGKDSMPMAVGPISSFKNERAPA
jgi:hypothetical protein